MTTRALPPIKSSLTGRPSAPDRPAAVGCRHRRSGAQALTGTLRARRAPSSFASNYGQIGPRTRDVCRWVTRHPLCHPRALGERHMLCMA
jgi:hypothetical protein